MISSGTEELNRKSKERLLKVEKFTANIRLVKKIGEVAEGFRTRR